MKSSEAYILPTSEYYTYSAGANARQYLLYLKVIGDYHHLPGYSMSRKSYDGFQLIIVLDGELIIDYDNKTWSGQKHDIFLIDCYQPHCFRSQVGSHCLWFHFDGSPARGLFNACNRKHGPLMRSTVLDYLTSTTRQIFNTLKTGEQVSDVRISMLLTDIVCELIESGTSIERILPGPEDRFQEVIQLMNENLSKPLSIHHMAETFGLSDAHFIRAFSKATGTTPKQYLIQSRVNKAKDLLQTTSLSIRTIGSMVGYPSESLFSNMFKRVTNISPRDYRALQISTEYPAIESDLQAISKSIINGNAKAASVKSLNAYRNGYDLSSILNVYNDSMEAIGDLYFQREIQFTDMLGSANALKECINVLSMHVPSLSNPDRYKVILGTVTGDDHSIGKDLVSMMMRINGFKTIDLGTGVSADMFIQALREHPDTDIVCISALLSTSLQTLRSTVERLNALPQRSCFRVMIGGSATTADFAYTIGADAYTKDAASAARKAVELVESARLKNQSSIAAL